MLSGGLGLLLHLSTRSRRLACDEVSDAVGYLLDPMYFHTDYLLEYLTISDVLTI